MLLCASIFVTLLALGTSSPAPGNPVSRDRVPPGGFAPGIPIQDCKFYCKNPLTKLYDCCDHIKPGKCPPKRPECPHYKFAGPTRCYIDTDCAGRDKCCYDVCLRHNTCKGPEFH
ncbi:uncharacterized protein LOC143024884 [Oratosquilla oratoria]|uniref:uncharacterized protein LOC143024884 n=1 Tax=Oratosquilla oratoria TaxID=337810 RepID=UPI003F76E975